METVHPIDFRSTFSLAGQLFFSYLQKAKWFLFAFSILIAYQMETAVSSFTIEHKNVVFGSNVNYFHFFLVPILLYLRIVLFRAAFAVSRRKKVIWSALVQDNMASWGRLIILYHLVFIFIIIIGDVLLSIDDVTQYLPMLVISVVLFCLLMLYVLGIVLPRLELLIFGQVVIGQAKFKEAFFLLFRPLKGRCHQLNLFFCFCLLFVLMCFFQFVVFYELTQYILPPISTLFNQLDWLPVHIVCFIEGLILTLWSAFLFLVKALIYRQLIGHKIEE